MTKDKEKQLFQIQNILDTLEEATEHFIILIKNKELNQSVFMFSSIVEGSQVAITMLNKIDESFKKNTNKLENYLFMIASELEKKNFIKIAEIVQFSLRPHLVRLNQTFIDVVGNQKKDKVISIGVFHSWANPRKFLPDARLKAIVGEANKQNSEIYFFTSDDVDFENELIHAIIFHNDFWKSVTIPFPDVIDNIGGGRISQTERKLRREIPFTSFHVGNKYTLPKRMIKYR